MLSTDGATNRAERVDLILSKLAEALNCPREVFTQSVSYDLSQSIELLNLWHSLKSSADRARLLATARSIAAEAQG